MNDVQKCLRSRTAIEEKNKTKFVCRKCIIAKYNKILKYCSNDMSLRSQQTFNLNSMHDAQYFWTQVSYQCVQKNDLSILTYRAFWLGIINNFFSQVGQSLLVSPYLCVCVNALDVHSWHSNSHLDAFRSHARTTVHCSCYFCVRSSHVTDRGGSLAVL